MNKSITPGHAIAGAAWVAAFILLLALVACDSSLGMNGMTPREYKYPLEIKTADIDARFHFTRTADEATSLCVAKGKRQPPLGYYTTGCAIRPQSQYNDSGRWLIIAVKPTSWNDYPSLANLGHEILHGLGGEHE